MRDFLKHIFATVIGLILFVTLGFAGLVFLLGVLASLGQETSPQVASKSILSFNLALNITDADPDADPSRLISNALSGTDSPASIGLRDAVTAIEAAAKDDRIVGLYLHGDVLPAGLGSGLATLREVRQALLNFQKAGKPIIAYTTAGSERDYYLLSVADTITLNPMGLLEINGLSSETTFFTGALQKYGVGVQVIRVGQYKAAVEPFTQTQSSPQNKEQTQQLLSDLWNELRSTTATSRKITPQQLQAIADTKGTLLPTQAKSAKLIDRIAYEDEIIGELRKLTGETNRGNDETEDDEDAFRQISLVEYADTVAAEADADGGKNQIAIVYAEGEIVSGIGGDGSIGGDRLVSELRELRRNEEVKAIVLRVNSPGGSAVASDAIAREVLITTKVKPVIVSMGSYAASGGYLISTYATQIFASPNTITGSIGVFGLLPNVQKLANNNGITWDVVQTGRLANSDTIARPKTPQELAINQTVVNQIYDQFLSSVSSSRSISKQQVANIAQGRVWSGIAAKRLGLVDDLGGLDAAIQAAAAQAKLGKDWFIEDYPRGSNFQFRLLQRFLGSRVATVQPPTDPLSLELSKLREDLRILQAMNDPLGTYTRLSFNPRID